jgi:hypothetical protein
LEKSDEDEKTFLSLLFKCFTEGTAKKTIFSPFSAHFQQNSHLEQSSDHGQGLDEQIPTKNQLKTGQN